MITRTIPNHKYEVQVFDKKSEDVGIEMFETVSKKFRTEASEINWLKKQCDELGKVFLNLKDHTITFDKYQMSEETFMENATPVIDEKE